MKQALLNRLGRILAEIIASYVYFARGHASPRHSFAIDGKKGFWGCVDPSLIRRLSVNNNIATTTIRERSGPLGAALTSGGAALRGRSTGPTWSWTRATWHESAGSHSTCVRCRGQRAVCGMFQSHTSPPPGRTPRGQNSCKYRRRCRHKVCGSRGGCKIRYSTLTAPA